jgi:hypothetical protein
LVVISRVGQTPWSIITALEPSDGKVLWSVQLDDNTQTGGVGGADGTIVVEKSEPGLFHTFVPEQHAFTGLASTRPPVWYVRTRF